MNFTQKSEVSKNAQRDHLRDINQKYTECISRDFLPDFLAGKNVSIENVCVDLRQQMLALDKQVYPKDNFAS